MQRLLAPGGRKGACCQARHPPQKTPGHCYRVAGAAAPPSDRRHHPSKPASPHGASHCLQGDRQPGKYSHAHFDHGNLEAQRLPCCTGQPANAVGTGKLRPAHPSAAPARFHRTNRNTRQLPLCEHALGEHRESLLGLARERAGRNLAVPRWPTVDDVEAARVWPPKAERCILTKS